MSDQIRVFARTPAGDVDITEGVQALYDLVIGSMNWGSGFWTVVDALPVVHVAQTCGFEGAEGYVHLQQHSEEQARFIKERQLRDNGGPTPSHDHVFSSRGVCMWPGCREVGVDAPDAADAAGNNSWRYL